MIRSFQMTDPANTCIRWGKGVPWFAGLTKLAFGPGLNIVYGPNGSGKSTLLRAMARLLCCTQGGVQVVTQTALFERKGDGCTVDHDGSPTLYFDAGLAIGLFGGQFDDDFFEEGVKNTVLHASSGHTTLHRLHRAVQAVTGKGAIPEVTWRAFTRPDDLALFLAGTGPRERPTVILDEPERSLDVRQQWALWKGLSTKVKDVQVIVATHSPFAVHLTDVTWIETAPDSVLMARMTYEAHFIDAVERVKRET